MSTFNTKAAFTFPFLLNTLGLAGICAVLAFAFAWQVAFDEIPCPLCLLQRTGFALVGVGFMLNVRFGSSPRNYGIIIISALAGAFAAGRQTLLHIGPMDAGYGSPFLGLHFYTWAFIAFMGTIAYCALLLMIDRAQTATSTHAAPNLLGRLIIGLFLALVAGNAISTLLECGFGACPDDPTGYLWLP